MYRASKALSLGQARDYYRKEYTRGDYYEHDTLERKGEWHGKGAERLGLRGEVEKAHFDALLQGHGPGGEVLVVGEAATDKHRAGWDFTCSADKSVSLVTLVGGDEGVRTAHRDAVDRSLAELERYVQTKDPSRDRVTTGEMVAAKFEHESSRKLDPQLHTHVVVMNMTPRSDGVWRALEPREMFAAQRLVTATYRAEMARELPRLGYAVEVRADGSVGIAGFTKPQLDHFSQRRAQIEAYLADHGVDGAAHAERAARTTRRAKARNVDRAEVVQAWRARANEQGVALPVPERAERRADRFASQTRCAPSEASRSVSHAMEHVSERKAVFHGRELDAEALVHGMGRITLDDVRGVARRELIDIRDVQAPSGRFTTWENLRLEERNVALMRAGSGVHEPVVPNLPALRGSGPPLSPPQERVARHILTSRDQVLGVAGKAGTGKTFTLASVRESAEAAGWRVRGFAPTTGAVKLLSESGIESGTVAALQNEKARRVGGRDLWIVDEAGMLSTRQAAVVLERARACGAKVVLIGDLRQHAAVEAGRPLRYLSDAGLSVARLDDIRRQQDRSLRLAVRDASEGRPQAAVARLERAGRVIEVKDPLERHRAIAEEAAKGEKRTLVIAPSNEEREQLNRLIRERLIAEGQLDCASVKLQIALDKGLTGPERRLTRNYAPGDSVRFARLAKAHGLDGEGRVLSVDLKRGRVTVELRDGRRVEHDPRRVCVLSVARLEERRFAVGDRLQFRAPDRERRIANGQLGTLRALDPGRATVELDGGRRVVLDLGRPQAFEHGYASTSHAAQGQTVPRVIVCVDTERPAALVNQQQFYVSISRAREEALVFTDSREDLPRAVSRAAEKTSALDFVNIEGRGDGTRPEPGRKRGAAAERMVRGEAGVAQECGDERRAPPGPRDAAPAARRDAGAGGAARRPSPDDRVPARAGGSRAAPAGRGAGAGAAGSLRRPREALGRDGGPVSGVGGRPGAALRQRALPSLTLDPDQGDAGRLSDGAGRGRPIGNLDEPLAGSGPAGDGPRPGRRSVEVARGDSETRSGEAPLSPLGRLRQYEKERGDLVGVLPPDLARASARLNVASLERGGPRIVTAGRVGQLGVETIRKVLALADPRRVAVAIAQELIRRTSERGADRER